MIDAIFNSKVLTIIFIVLALAAIVAGTLEYISTEIMLTFFTIFGFSGVAAFRDWINSQGYKTYVVAGLAIAGAAGLYFKFITVEQLLIIVSIFTGGAAVTLTQAVKKVPAGQPKLLLKKAA